MIAHNALNNVSDDETLVSPAELLMRTRKLIENAFAATGRKDGMDISVAAFFKIRKRFYGQEPICHFGFVAEPASWKSIPISSLLVILKSLAVLKIM